MKQDLKYELGVRVRLHRHKARLTQEELGARIERTAETISNIERGRSLPTMQTLALIADILAIPIREFFSSSPTSEASALRTELEARLSMAASSMPTSVLEIAVQQTEALAGISETSETPKAND